jgi:hypothetical protein
VDIEELKAFMESEIEVGESTKHSLSVTGEPYVVLTSGGIKPEGLSWPMRWHDTIEQALEDFRAEFLKYKASVPGGKLYWRWPQPEIHHHDGKVCVAARILITEAKPDESWKD